MALHLHPLPGDENRYSPEEFERDIKPLIKFGNRADYVPLPRDIPEWLKNYKPQRPKITEKLYEPPTKSYYDAKEWREYLSGAGVDFPPDSAPSEIHILPWASDVTVPTLWQRFMAWWRS